MASAKKAPADAGIQVRFKELSARGTPYALNEKQFPPGEWVTVDEGELAYLSRRRDRFEVKGAE